jgi:hypothetical protein
MALLLAACGSSVESEPTPTGDFEEIGTIDTSTLPVTMDFDYRGDHVVVDTGFGTDETFPMMLDTGAPLNVSAGLVEQFGFPVVGQQEAQAGGGTVTSDVVGVQTLTMGGLKVSLMKGITPWVGTDNPLSCVTENGLVGGNVMSQAVWQIDYQAKTVTVTQSTDGIDHVEGAIKLPTQTLTGLGKSPVIGLGLGNAGLGFLVDTGSSFGIVAAPKDLEGVGVTAPPGAPTVKTRIAGAGGAFDADLAYIPSQVGLNETTTIEYPVAAGDIVAGIGNIGNAFLSQFIVTFDFPNSTIYLDPISDDGTVAPPTIPGATVGWDGTNAIVSSIAVGSDADKAGLKVGDVVTEVDGEPITSQPEFCETFTGPPAETITTDAGEFDAGVFEDFFTIQ